MFKRYIFFINMNNLNYLGIRYTIDRLDIMTEEAALKTNMVEPKWDL